MGRLDARKEGAMRLAKVPTDNLPECCRNQLRGKFSSLYHRLLCVECGADWILEETGLWRPKYTTIKLFEALERLRIWKTNYEEEAELHKQSFQVIVEQRALLDRLHHLANFALLDPVRHYASIERISDLTEPRS